MLTSATATVPFMACINQAGERLTALGRAVALSGVVLPLLLIGILKFTSIEIEALKPFVENTPWLAWLYPAFGFAGASYFLGVVELGTALLLLASLRSIWAGNMGGAMGSITFALTASTMLTLPIWETGSGGFPFLNGLGAFLIKDVALLGVSLVVLGGSLQRLVSSFDREIDRGDERRSEV
ncbi:YkgB family protein [Mesorhizobium sp. YC-39]|uniref:YkgB family protein n=1 Tax=unclassified Mesorhizobium TaxID=325217 RepID=UPI0021E8C698|nr:MULTISPECIES: YkgB family protein [unclassified Mesorhizobium]MCV3210383.1 YkgB family protein [Mesorhizobium sp. YC-2]MCV3230913.1 YkgB family protein [Mesorhizobium sp. YC-39]